MGKLETRESYIQGLREFADWLELNKDFPMPNRDIRVYGWGDSPESVKLAVGAMVHGADGLVKKDSASRNDDIELTRQFSGVSVQFIFSKQSLGCQKVSKTRTITEESWECGPILDAIKEAGQPS